MCTHCAKTGQSAPREEDSSRNSAKLLLTRENCKTRAMRQTCRKSLAASILIPLREIHCAGAGSAALPEPLPEVILLL
jgi:hypothetical protein